LPYKSPESTVEIAIELDESVVVPDIDLGATIEVIAEVIANAKSAAATRAARKAAPNKQVQDVLAALLESPQGLTPGELLASSDCENLSSIILRVRRHLSSANLYTLIKKRVQKQTIYILIHADNLETHKEA
jgi:hypothetical protein